jgi:hypothetical protein
MNCTLSSTHYAMGTSILRVMWNILNINWATFTVGGVFGL